jgi:hypothetical protein
MPAPTQDQRDVQIRAILSSPLQGAFALPSQAACMLDRLLQLARVHTQETPKGNEVSLIFADRFRFWFREYPGKAGVPVWQYEGFEGGEFSTW